MCWHRPNMWLGKGVGRGEQIGARDTKWSWGLLQSPRNGARPKARKWRFKKKRVVLKNRKKEQTWGDMGSREWRGGTAHPCPWVTLCATRLILIKLQFDHSLTPACFGFILRPDTKPSVPRWTRNASPHLQPISPTTCLLRILDWVGVKKSHWESQSHSVLWRCECGEGH